MDNICRKCCHIFVLNSPARDINKQGRLKGGTVNHCLNEVKYAQFHWNPAILAMNLNSWFIFLSQAFAFEYPNSSKFEKKICAFVPQINNLFSL